MKEWVRTGNTKLAEVGFSTRVKDSFGHTGNFVIESKDDSSEVAKQLQSIFNTPFSVISLDELRKCVPSAERGEVPEQQANARWTLGMVFAVEGQPVAKEIHDTPHARFRSIAPNIVGAWKQDQLTGSGILDRDRRAGGWGAVSGYVSRQVGGKWTARSLRTVRGILGLACGHEPSRATSSHQLAD
jgi:hypothetical protein